MLRGFTLTMLVIATGLVLAAPPTAAQEVYLMAADVSGCTFYIPCNMDGTFGEQQYIGQTPQPYYTYGNSIGDFDDDGDYDYVIGSGSPGESDCVIYLYEKLRAGPDFALPVSVATWEEGAYFMDMAVADYNNDGNLDFIVTHFGSTNCELYLGHGDLTFTRSVLNSTSDLHSIGADAADFNNDGNADFVVVPYYLGDCFVNLGNGDGTFTSIAIPTVDDS